MADPKPINVALTADLDVVKNPDAGDELEFYYLISYIIAERNESERRRSFRLPELEHWSCRPGRPCRRGDRLVDFNLYEGETAIISITLMEEDFHWPVQQVAEAGKAILRALGYKNAASAVGWALKQMPENADDVIGSVVCYISNSEQRIHHSWAGVPGSGYEGSDNLAAGIKAHLIGQGGDDDVAMLIYVTP